VRIFAFVAAQKADFPVRTLCRVCQVSVSGFYAWAARLAAGPGPAAAARQITAAHIARVHAASRRRYGSPRVTAQLAREGIVVNHKTVEREMARAGLAGRCSRRKIRTTRRDPSRLPAADLVRRDFARSRPDELWIGDATYIWTDEGWCYLATVVDACSRRLLGWSITDHLRTELCLDALQAAVATRGGRRHLAAGIVFHSDHGTQYTADAFRAACRSLGITQSMGTVGDSYDNAMAESFFSGFKREAIDGEHFATRADARKEIFTWLTWYNQTRLHSSIGDCPPIEYEHHLAQQSLVA
jgi:transposase InsO family protein